MSPSVVEKIKDQFGLHICCCLGLLTSEQALTLRHAGVDRINHNLNTSRRFTTDLLDAQLRRPAGDAADFARRGAGAVLRADRGNGRAGRRRGRRRSRAARDRRRIDPRELFCMRFRARPSGHTHVLNPRYCLKVLCLMRLANPSTEIRIAGGREVNLSVAAAAGALSGELTVRQRLPHHQGAAG